ncbi:Cell division protein FtsQ [Furfurilactobacillus rossiae]|uniref:cell division protein FtsQ/DivIB n=1 Tax=Furfurilactobacillus rossiae TaxID=231049 RepID=UPI0015C01837|nr:cell division protein FtsQ/DivIB [Furfurilactobacillus rossiae]QLE64497.1 Cell division protein FtsQ [Furfurilactobacillus rossiae]
MADIANRVELNKRPPRHRWFHWRKRKRTISVAKGDPQKGGKGSKKVLKPIKKSLPKPPRPDAQNRHRRNVMTGGFMTVIVILAIIGSPLFSLSKISAPATRNLTGTQIVRASGLQVGQPLWTVWGHQQKIFNTAKANNDMIHHLTISRDGFRSVKLNVEEYRQAGYLLRKGKYYVVIENGRILSTALSRPVAGYPVYSGFSHDDTFATVIKQYAGLSSDIKRGISQIDLSPTKSNPERLHMFMNDGNEVYATAATFGSKMKYYPEIVAQMNGKGIINLEVGAYSYPFGFDDNAVSSSDSNNLSSQNTAAGSVATTTGNAASSAVNQQSSH